MPSTMASQKRCRAKTIKSITFKIMKSTKPDAGKSSAKLRLKQVALFKEEVNENACPILLKWIGSLGVTAETWTKEEIEALEPPLIIKYVTSIKLIHGLSKLKRLREKLDMPLKDHAELSGLASIISWYALLISTLPHRC